MAERRRSKAAAEPGDGTPIWKDAEFAEWYRTRPGTIQKAICDYPPNRLYKLAGPGIFPGTISCYSEKDDNCGPVTVKVVILSPRLLREVFGVDLADLTPLTVEEETEWAKNAPPELVPTWLKNGMGRKSA